MILSSVPTKDGKYLSVSIKYDNMIVDHNPGYLTEYIKRGIHYRYTDIVQIFDSNTNEYKTYLVLSNQYLVTLSTSTEKFLGEKSIEIKCPCCRYTYQDTSRLIYVVQLDVDSTYYIKDAIQFQNIPSHEAFRYVIKLWEFLDDAPKLYHHLYNYLRPVNW